MYAIVESGGKQYKVKEDDVIEVEKLNKKDGSKIQIKEVLLVSDKKVKVGTPYVEKCSVDCTVIENFKQDKKIAFKYRRRKSSQSKIGHRQKMTKLKVEKINFKK